MITAQKVLFFKHSFKLVLNVYIYFSYSDEIGDRNKTGPIRLIYRKDLDPNYVAYYELQFGNRFYIFSAGPKTKDHRLVQEGENQRPTDFLIEEATKNDNTCYKFFRLSPDGVTICEDRNGRAVATTMDLNTLTTVSL